MDSRQILAKLQSADAVATPQALAFLESLPAGSRDDVLTETLKGFKGFVLTDKELRDTASKLGINVGSIQTKRGNPAVEVVRTDYKPFAKEVDAVVEVPKGQSDGTDQVMGTAEDFVAYFKNRFQQISPAIRNRVTGDAVVSASQLKTFVSGRNARLIGLVVDKRETKNGHTIIEIEDESSTQACLIPKDAPASLVQKAKQIIPDEIIGFDGYPSGTLFIVKDVVWPEVPIRNRPLVDKDVSVAMLSDLHFGSQLFLKRQFESFLRFLRGEGTTTEQQKQAGKIKYVIIGGDVVDGIGIYPGQEAHLETKDIFEQYHIFCNYLKEIPDYISIIVIPGNHDAVRIAEPQPPLLPEFLEPVKGYSNITSLPNPGRVKLEGLETLVYHGGSFFSMISELPNIANALERPEKVGIEWLRRRHLSPTYGTNPIVPQAKDPLVISTMPDILHFGHVHHNGYEDYRGTMVVNSGTWQDYTDLQTKLGIRITPCELPIYSFKTGQLNILKFRDANLTPDKANPEARLELPPCAEHPGERHAPHGKAS